MATRLERLYANDFFAWTLDQAAALRHLAELRPNDELDLEYLIEEVEDLGASRRKGGPQSSAPHPRASVEARALRPPWSRAPAGANADHRRPKRPARRPSTPTLRRDLADGLADLQARRDTAQRLPLHDRVEAAAALPAACP